MCKVCDGWYFTKALISPQIISDLFNKQSNRLLGQGESATIRIKHHNKSSTFHFHRRKKLDIEKRKKFRNDKDITSKGAVVNLTPRVKIYISFSMKINRGKLLNFQAWNRLHALEKKNCSAKFQLNEIFTKSRINCSHALCIPFQFLIIFKCSCIFQQICINIICFHRYVYRILTKFWAFLH